MNEEQKVLVCVQVNDPDLIEDSPTIKTSEICQCRGCGEDVYVAASSLWMLAHETWIICMDCLADLVDEAKLNDIDMPYPRLAWDDDQEEFN